MTNPHPTTGRKPEPEELLGEVQRLLEEGEFSVGGWSSIEIDGKWYVTEEHLPYYAEANAKAERYVVALARALREALERENLAWSANEGMKNTFDVSESYRHKAEANLAAALEREKGLLRMVEAADALRERVRIEDVRARDLGRWHEAAAYDDARAALAGVEEEP